MYLFVCESVCVAACVWPTSAGWMMKWKVNESCQGKIIAVSKILKPPERQRESPHAASEKRPWEKIMSILLLSLLVYMLLIAFCVWLIGVCVALAPFVPLDVFTLVPMCLCDRNSHSLFLCVCVCSGPLALRVTSNRTVRNCCITSWTPWEWRRQRWVHDWFFFFFIIIIFFFKSNFWPSFHLGLISVSCNTITNGQSRSSCRPGSNVHRIFLTTCDLILRKGCFWDRIQIINNKINSNIVIINIIIIII